MGLQTYSRRFYTFHSKLSPQWIRNRLATVSQFIFSTILELFHERFFFFCNDLEKDDTINSRFFLRRTEMFRNTGFTTVSKNCFTFIKMLHNCISKPFDNRFESRLFHNSFEAISQLG